MNEKRSTDNHMTDPETWVDEHGDYLYRYALSRIHDPEIAEDLVQDTSTTKTKCSPMKHGEEPQSYLPLYSVRPQ